MPAEERAVILGAGPVGLVSAIYLGRAGFHVNVYDERSFPAEDADHLHGWLERTWFFLLSARGLKAAMEVGQQEQA